MAAAAYGGGGVWWRRRLPTAAGHGETPPGRLGRRRHTAAATNALSGPGRAPKRAGLRTGPCPGLGPGRAGPGWPAGRSSLRCGGCVAGRDRLRPALRRGSYRICTGPGRVGIIDGMMARPGSAEPRRPRPRTRTARAVPRPRAGPQPLPPPLALAGWCWVCLRRPRRFKCGGEPLRTRESRGALPRRTCRGAGSACAAAGRGSRVSFEGARTPRSAAPLPL
jgi:hypothetical protein